MLQNLVSKISHEKEDRLFCNRLYIYIFLFYFEGQGHEFYWKEIHSKYREIEGKNKKKKIFLQEKEKKNNGQ